MELILLIINTVLLILVLVMKGWVVVVVDRLSKKMTQVTVDTSVIEALTEAAIIARAVADDLKSNLAIQRTEFQRLIILLDRMDSKISAGGAAGLRIEKAGERVAGHLETAQAEVDRVVDDLDTERVTPRPTKRTPRK